MEKKRVSVQIEGRSYSLITTDDEKYVQKVANEVLSHIRKAAQSTKRALIPVIVRFLRHLTSAMTATRLLKRTKIMLKKPTKLFSRQMILTGFARNTEKSLRRP